MTVSDVIDILIEEYNPSHDSAKSALIVSKVSVWALKEPHPLVLYLTVKIDLLSFLISQSSSGSTNGVANGVDIRQLDLEIKFSQQPRLLLQLMSDVATLLKDTKIELANNTYLTGQLSAVIPKAFSFYYTPYVFT